MKGEIFILLATLLAALGWIASKMVILDVPGDIFIALRFFIASLVLYPFCYKALRKLNIKQILSACSVGLILSLGIQIWIYAVSISDSLAEGAFIMSLAMIIAPIISWLLFKTRPNKAFGIALPIAIIGMMLLSLSDGWHIEKSQIFYLLSAATLSLHFVMNKRVVTNIKPLPLIFLQLLTIGISSGIFVCITTHEPYVWTSNAIAWFIISTLVATSARYLLQAMGQHRTNITTAALIMILEPVWTLFLSITVMGDVLAPQKLLGAGVIIISLFIYIKGNTLLQHTTSTSPE